MLCSIDFFCIIDLNSSKLKNKFDSNLHLLTKLDTFSLIYTKLMFRVIPCEITHLKNESLPIVFILSTKSAHPMRFHNSEYQPRSGGWDSGLCVLIWPILYSILDREKNLRSWFFFGQKLCCFRWNDPLGEYSPHSLLKQTKSFKIFWQFSLNKNNKMYNWNEFMVFSVIRN